MAVVLNLAAKIRPVIVFTQLNRSNFSLSGITSIYKNKMVDAIYAFDYRRHFSHCTSHTNREMSNRKQIGKNGYIKMLLLFQTNTLV